MRRLVSKICRMSHSLGVHLSPLMTDKTCCLVIQDFYRQLKAAEKPTQMSLPPGVCMKLKWNYTNSIINQLSIEYSVL